ncbi:unnamed protein product [Mytilus edulis]|uniref:Uncharacterized protein n=1 Tax=Mytilus edulis TaxID=6550 RepID=A0A8S3RS34_MYTED|nr:unnamed protein product [Mytilus edulis]
MGRCVTKRQRVYLCCENATKQTFILKEVMDKGVRFNNRTVHASYTKYEHSESDSECRFSCNTTSTDSTTLRRRNRNLKLAIQSLKSTINLLTSGTVKYMDSYVETLEKKVNIKKLISKGQMRNSEKLLKDTTIFLTDRVKAMRKTMLEHRVKTEQVLDEVEHLLNGVEEQNEPQHSDFQTFLSPMKDLNDSLVNYDQLKNERLESTTASPSSSPLDHEDANIQSYRIVEYLDTEEQEIDPVPSYTPSEESNEIILDFTNNFGSTSNIASQVSPLETEEIGIEQDFRFFPNTRFTIQPNSPSNVPLLDKEMELPSRRHSQMPISTGLQEQMPLYLSSPLKVQKNACCICQ